jgi:hypothetical protein
MVKNNGGNAEKFSQAVKVKKIELDLFILAAT